MRARRSQRKTGATFPADALGRRGGVSVSRPRPTGSICLRASGRSRVDLSSGIVWVIRSSMLILPSMYQSTIFGTSVRPRAPPKAVPFQTRPVTSWNGRVAISLPGAGDADDDAVTPAAVAAFERLAHDVHIADAFEGEVGAAAGQVDDGLHDLVAADLVRVDEVRSCRTSGHARLRSGLMSTPMILSAPTMRAPWIDVEADAARGRTRPRSRPARPWRCR